jgi:hypothetical protein
LAEAGERGSFLHHTCLLLSRIPHSAVSLSLTASLRPPSLANRAFSPFFKAVQSSSKQFKAKIFTPQKLCRNLRRELCRNPKTASLTGRQPPAAASIPPCPGVNRAFFPIFKAVQSISNQNISIS